MNIPEISYRGKWFTTNISPQIVHAAKGDLKFQVVGLGEVVVKQIDDFQYWDSDEIRLVVNWAGKTFALTALGEDISVGPEAPDLGADSTEEWQGLLGEMLSVFFESHGLHCRPQCS